MFHFIRSLLDSQNSPTHNIKISQHHYLCDTPTHNETVKAQKTESRTRRKMAKDKKDMESVTDYVEEKALDQEKTNAAMAKMRISEKKSGDEDRYVQHFLSEKKVTKTLFKPPNRVQIKETRSFND